MVADVAHDLRTPLSVLRSEIEAMQDGVRRADGAGLERLHAEVMTLARLVEDLRTLSLAEAGPLPMRRAPCALAPLLHRTAEAFAVRAASDGVPLRVDEVEPGLSATVDADRMLRLLANLVDNALRHAEGGPVELGAAARDGGVALWVRDHGPGLPPGDPERLFERFYRGDAARTRGEASDGAGDGDARGSGSGLGLAIARALAEAHGGRISARDHPDGGAVFTVWLPADAGPPQPS